MWKKKKIKASKYINKKLKSESDTDSDSNSDSDAIVIFISKNKFEKM